MSVYWCIGGPLHSLAFLDHLAPINIKNLYLFFFQFLKAVPLFPCFYCDAYKERKKTGTNTFICQPLRAGQASVIFLLYFFRMLFSHSREKRQKVCCSPDPDPPLLFAIYYSCTLFFFFASSLPGSGLVHSVYHSTSYLISSLLRHCFVLLAL